MVAPQAVLGSLGWVITMLLGAVVVTARLPWLCRVAGPVIAVGTMSLTVYLTG